MGGAVWWGGGVVGVSVGSELGLPHRGSGRGGAGRSSCPAWGTSYVGGLAEASVYLDKSDEHARADLPCDAG